jgi:TPR repeat protein
MAFIRHDLGGCLMFQYRRSITAVSFAFFLLHLSTPVWQSYAQGRSGGAGQPPRQLAEGLAYLQKRQYTPALNLLEPLAQQGVPAAQTAVAEMYEKGLGVQRNFITAETWYSRAIAQGDATAGKSVLPCMSASSSDSRRA